MVKKAGVRHDIVEFQIDEQRQVGPVHHAAHAVAAIGREEFQTELHPADQAREFARKGARDTDINGVDGAENRIRAHAAVFFSARRRRHERQPAANQPNASPIRNGSNITRNSQICNPSTKGQKLRSTIPRLETAKSTTTAATIRATVHLRKRIMMP
jgi:hypothetical protein